MAVKKSRLQQAEQAAEACRKVLEEQFGARRVYLFGSLAGHSPWHSRSDVDLAVEGLAPERYVSALSALWELMPEGLELDLITLEDAPPELAARIRGEVKMPEDPKEALRKEIGDERVNLGRLVDEAKQLLQRITHEPTFVEIRAAASLVHDFYCGVERLFERIVVRLGPGLPGGPGGHTLLLRSMESSVEGIRPSVIDHALALCLLDYLRFRHLFRHTYGYELQWDKLRPLIERLEETYGRVSQQTDHFLETVK